MTIVSFGCSLTSGTDLPDSIFENKFPTPSQLTWPALVSKRLGLGYIIRAQGGTGNLAISDRVYKNIHNFTDPSRFFIVNWTFIDRFDYSDPGGMHFNSGFRDFCTCRPNESDDLSKFYYRNFYSEYRDKLVNLMYIRSIINVLENHKIKFVMTAIDDLLWEQRWHAPPHITELQDEIRPYILDFEGRNFLAWSRHRGFEISPAGHPLEEAHAAAAEIMMPIVQKLIKT